MDKDKNFKFIKDFSEISVTKICSDLDINRSNIFSNRASAKNIEKVRNEIDKKIANLYYKDKVKWD